MAEQGSSGSGGAASVPGGREVGSNGVTTVQATPVGPQPGYAARRLGLRQAPQVFQRLRHGPADLTRRHPIGDQAEESARRLIGQPEADLCSAVGTVPQAEPAALRDASDADPGRSRASSNSTTSTTPPIGTEPIFKCTVYRGPSRRPLGRGVPSLEVRHELRIASRVADPSTPCRGRRLSRHAVAVSSGSSLLPRWLFARGLIAAPATRQPITGKRRSAASRSTRPAGW